MCREPVCFDAHALQNYDLWWWEDMANGHFKATEQSSQPFRFHISSLTNIKYSNFNNKHPSVPHTFVMTPVFASIWETISFNTPLDLFLPLVLQQLCWNHITLQIKVEKILSVAKTLLVVVTWLPLLLLGEKWFASICEVFFPIATESKVMSVDKNKKRGNRKSVCPHWADYGSHGILYTPKVFCVFVCGRWAQWMEAHIYRYYPEN